MRHLLTAFALVLLVSAPALARSEAVERQFRDWLANDLWPQARQRGVSAATFNAAFDGVTLNWKLPDLVPPGTRPETPRKQRQAEFGAPAKYFNPGTVQGAAAGGREHKARLAATLKRVESAYAVPGRILLAIWARESGFGRAKIPHDAFEVLGTKAFMSTRKEMFRNELLAALQMAQNGVPPRNMKSSWAGALGQPQFMPSSYLKHAADGDGDGRADIWGSQADTLASIASYLRHHGWQTGRDWGFEVVVPQSVACTLEGPDQGRTIAQWEAMGIRRVNGKPFPAHELKGEGYLMMPAGRLGPAFIVTPNFYVLKDYNESDLYALFVGHVGDRIEWNVGDFTQGWGKIDKLWRSDIAAMQRVLERQGHDVGGADGLPGFKTRRSIGAWQAKNGRQPTCFPDAELIRAIR